MNFSMLAVRKMTAMFLVTVLMSMMYMPARAAMYSTDALSSMAELENRRVKVTQTLLRDDVRQQLVALDVNPQDVENRVQQMTPYELSQLEGRLDQLPAGSGVLGTILVVLLIFILLDIAGVTDIFPGV